MFRCYLENYNTNFNPQKKIYFFNPKIMNSTAYHKNELFKFWLAQKIEEVQNYYQHGDI